MQILKYLRNVFNSYQIPLLIQTTKIQTFVKLGWIIVSLKGTVVIKEQEQRKHIPKKNSTSKHQFQLPDSSEKYPNKIPAARP